MNTSPNQLIIYMPLPKNNLIEYKKISHVKNSAPDTLQIAEKIRCDNKHCM